MVGWPFGARVDTDLVITALYRAQENRRPSPGLIFHSDRGSQYASEKVHTFIKNHNWLQSMSKKGDCWDNACEQSFFASIKTEELFHDHFLTRKEAFSCIFEYIEIFYNRQRLHSSLGYKTPEECEIA